MSGTFAHLIYFLRGIMTEKNTMELPMILAVMVALSLFTVLPTLAEGNAVSEVQRAIEDTGVSWTAGETSVSGYSLEDKLRLCGAKIGPIPVDAVVLVPPADYKVSTAHSTGEM